jgi:hypothetical protein
MARLMRPSRASLFDANDGFATPAASRGVASLSAHSLRPAARAAVSARGEAILCLTPQGVRVDKSRVNNAGVRPSIAHNWEESA